MSDNIDLKALWTNLQTAAPDYQDLLTSAKKYRRAAMRKLIAANILLVATSAFIIAIWHFYQPQMATTKAGIMLILIAMAAYLLVYNRMIPALGKADSGADSSRYLAQLLKLKAQQRFLQTTMLNVYFILLSAGICLYLYEYTSRMSRTGAAITYGITLLWIGINWFYFRPKTIRKQQAALDGLIDKFEALRTQLKTDE